MDAVTYPAEEVAQLMNESFINYQADISSPRPDLREVFQKAKPFWAPMFLIFNARGTELRRWTGWLAPWAFVDELRIGLTIERFSRNDPAGALEQLEAILAGSGLAKAEAMYLKGAALYKGGNGDLASLKKVWIELRETFPDSTWAMRADVLEFADAPNRE